MNDHNGELDNELAAFTDRLLRGEDAMDTESLEDLGPVVRQLHRALTADQRSDEDAIRDRMRQRLAQEWPQQRPVRTRQVTSWRFTRSIQLAAAALLLVVMVGAVLLAGDSGENGGLQGTASGSEIDLLPVVLVALGLVIAVFWYVRQRRG